MTSVSIITDRNLVLILSQLQNCHIPVLEKFTVKCQLKNLFFSLTIIANCDCAVYLSQNLSMTCGNMEGYFQCPNARNHLYQVFTLEIAGLFLEAYGTYNSPLNDKYFLSVSENNFSFLSLCFRKKNQSTEIRYLLFLDFTVIFS